MVFSVSIENIWKHKVQLWSKHQTKYSFWEVRLYLQFHIKMYSKHNIVEFHIHLATTNCQVVYLFRIQECNFLSFTKSITKSCRNESLDRRASLGFYFKRNIFSIIRKLLTEMKRKSFLFKIKLILFIKMIVDDDDFNMFTWTEAELIS